jgi:hypothetical protein
MLALVTRLSRPFPMRGRYAGQLCACCSVPIEVGEPIRFASCRSTDGIDAAVLVGHNDPILCVRCVGAHPPGCVAEVPRGRRSERAQRCEAQLADGRRCRQPISKRGASAGRCTFHAPAGEVIAVDFVERGRASR